MHIQPDRVYKIGATSDAWWNMKIVPTTTLYALPKTHNMPSFNMLTTTILDMIKES